MAQALCVFRAFCGRQKYIFRGRLNLPTDLTGFTDLSVGTFSWRKPSVHSVHSVGD